jgi:hypothetical protein
MVKGVVPWGTELIIVKGQATRTESCMFGERARRRRSETMLEWEWERWTMAVAVALFKQGCWIARRGV